MFNVYICSVTYSRISQTCLVSSGNWVTCLYWILGSGPDLLNPHLQGSLLGLSVGLVSAAGDSDATQVWKTLMQKIYYISLIILPFLEVEVFSILVNSFVRTEVWSIVYRYLYRHLWLFPESVFLEMESMSGSEAYRFFKAFV